MWILLLALACSKPPAPSSEPAPSPAPVAVAQPAPAPAPSKATPCVERCMHDSMARAVPAEVIEADCHKACDTQTLARTKADLDMRLGQRITVAGTYKRTLHHKHGPEPYLGTAVVLSDGTNVWISTGKEVPAGFEKWLDQAVHVEGTLSQGEPNDPDPWLLEPLPPTAPGL